MSRSRETQNNQKISSSFSTSFAFRPFFSERKQSGANLHRAPDPPPHGGSEAKHTIEHIIEHIIENVTHVKLRDGCFACHLEYIAAKKATRDDKREVRRKQKKNSTIMKKNLAELSQFCKQNVLVH